MVRYVYKRYVDENCAEREPTVCRQRGEEGYPPPPPLVVVTLCGRAAQRSSAAPRSSAKHGGLAARHRPRTAHGARRTAPYKLPRLEINIAIGVYTLDGALA